MNKTNNFDRLADWEKFSQYMSETYLARPIKKYSGAQQMNDFLHYTGLRVMIWNILKYALCLWLGSGKQNDFEKIAHYAQMAYTLKERKKLAPPFVNPDSDEEYVLSQEV